MVTRLDGRVVLITGASSGIGRETALLAATEGASVAAIDIDAEGLAATVDAVRHTGGQIRARIADVSDRAALATSIRELAEEVGPLNAVFANAGILSPPSAAAELDWQEWDRVLSVNLTGAVQ